jgi:hypothetical protein
VISSSETHAGRYQMPPNVGGLNLAVARCGGIFDAMEDLFRQLFHNFFNGHAVRTPDFGYVDKPYFDLVPMRFCRAFHQ